MTQQLNEPFESWIGLTLKDEAGHKIGTIEDIYTDDDTGQPEWLAVITGHSGSNISFVPLTGATPSGDDLQVNFPKNQVKDAPSAGSDARLSQEEEAHLYAHYGLDYDQERIRLRRWLDSERTGATDPDAHDGEGAPRSSAVDRERTMSGLDTAETDNEMRLRHEGSTQVQPAVAPGWAMEDDLERDRRIDPIDARGTTRRR